MAIGDLEVVRASPGSLLKTPLAAAARLWSGARNLVSAWCPCHGVGPGPGVAGVVQRTPLMDGGSCPGCWCWSPGPGLLQGCGRLWIEQAGLTRQGRPVSPHL